MIADEISLQKLISSSAVISFLLLFAQISFSTATGLQVLSLIQVASIFHVACCAGEAIATTGWVAQTELGSACKLDEILCFHLSWIPVYKVHCSWVCCYFMQTISLREIASKVSLCSFIHYCSPCLQSKSFVWYTWSRNPVADLTLVENHVSLLCSKSVVLFVAPYGFYIFTRRLSCRSSVCLIADVG